MRGLGVMVFCGLMLAVLAPVQARPRDEVMSGAYRCAGIGDSRTWLDCFYGAAQPARAALALKPAPSRQVALVTSPPAGEVRDVAVRETVMADVFHCGDTAEDRAWLDCYYAAAQPMRVSLGLAAPAPQPAAHNDVFGLAPLKPQPIPANTKQVWSRMAEYSFNKLNIFTVTLENKQVWRQIDGDTDVAHWKGAPSSYLVHITRGFLGSFNLQVKGEPRLFKVLRVR